MFKLDRHRENPILSPGEKEWQKAGVFNGVPVRKDGKVYLLFRALSQEKDHEGQKMEVSVIGKAESPSGVNFDNKEKFIEPERDWERFGCEDPRVAKIEDKYFITYTAISDYPLKPEGIKIGVAVSADLEDVEQKKLVTNFNSKAMVLFPERIRGELGVVLTANCDKLPARISLATFDNKQQLWSPDYWDRWYSRLGEKVIPLLGTQRDRVEVGTAPLKTDYGWLLLYLRIRNHLNSPEFGVDAALLDKEDPMEIKAKSTEPILEAKKDYEREKKPGIVFPSGALVEDDQLSLYYGASDKYCCLATGSVEELVKDMESEEKIWSFAEEELGFERFENNPLLEPRPESYWEAKAVFNPAAVKLNGEVHLLYRAMSEGNTSVLGYARSEDGYRIDERSDSPVYSPREEFEKKKTPGNSGCEDPRLTKIEDELYMTYTAYDGENPTRVALSTIKVTDFLDQRWNWSEPRLISPPGIDDKNSCIIEHDGRYVIFHRIYPCIWIDFVDDLNFKDQWIKGRAIIKPRDNKWDSRKVGIAAPPLETEAGLLLLYHASGDDKKYRVGAVLLEPQNPTQIKARTEKPLLEPEKDYEINGQVQNVVFPCGAVKKNDELLIYYGGADKVVAGARMKLEDLFEQLTN